MEDREWVLKRNCSLTPGQLGCAFCVLCGMTLAVALVFLLLHGAWWIFAYAVLESTVAALAFVLYARHATDHERIQLHAGSLQVGRIEAGRAELTTLDPALTRVSPPDSSTDLIRLQAHGKRVEVGRYVSAVRRKQVAGELRQALYYAGSSRQA